MFGFQYDGLDPIEPAKATFYEWPASYHNKAGALSFADGHAEIHGWRDPRTTPPVVKGQALLKMVPSPNNTDLIWLFQRTTSKK